MSFILIASIVSIDSIYVPDNTVNHIDINIIKQE
jgi:hypothetical protein